LAKVVGSTPTRSTFSVVQLWHYFEFNLDNCGTKLIAMVFQ
jgi:hypothetical protein